MSLSVLLNINADWYIFPYATDFTLFLQINQLLYNEKSIENVPEEFKKRFGRDVEDLFGDRFNKLISDGMLEILDGRYTLTRKGLDFANLVFGEFI